MPEKSAVVCDNGSFTFKELLEASGRVAARLQKHGVKKGDFVTIELPRVREYHAAIFGTLMAGAAYVPLELIYPQERRDYIAKNCNAKVRVDTAWITDLEQETPLTEYVPTEPLDSSLVIYTSGSTGNPKGVVHTQQSISANAVRAMPVLQPSAADKFVNVAPMSFIAAQSCVFITMTAAIPFYNASLALARDPGLLAAYIREHQITVAFISPKMLKVFHGQGDSLRLVFTGSERVSNTYSSEYEIVNSYGSSESFSGVLFFTIDRPYPNTPIGKPTGSEKFYLLDEEGKEAQEGELCLTGYFAREYLGLPEQSEKTFVDNPFRDRDGHEKMLRTGDIVRKLPDGNLLYVNRKDWMVKINGQRVEPGEIEEAIRKCDGIADAAIKAFTNEYDQTYLCAYYIEKSPMDEAALRKTLGAVLPEYMLPAFFVKLDKFPLNSNGKLDKKALKRPDTARFQREYAAPENDAEKAICTAMEEILKLERVGTADDFFLLGGDSIKAVMLADALKDMGADVSLIFAGRTPKELARLLDGKEPSRVRKHDKTPDGRYELTPSELGMYLSQKIDPNSTEYNLNICLDIEGSDADALTSAVKKLIGRHEALRSSYGDRNGTPYRQVTDFITPVVWKRAAGREEVERIASADLKPFDLSEVPLRITGYTISKKRHILHFAVHHIAFDGGSAVVLVDELSKLLAEEALPLKEIDLSDVSFADHSGEYERGLAYFRKVFADGISSWELPLDVPRHSSLSFRLFPWSLRDYRGQRMW